METSVNHSMCRCCASEGAFKDVKSTYHWMGEEEIYADMLRECFDINLNTSEDCDESGICEVCITQLRNAINFKKQVLHTEEHYKKLVQNKALFRTNIVKIEANADDDSEGNVSADDAFSGAEFDVPIKTEEEEQKPKKRAATTKTMTTRSKKAKTESGETSTKRIIIRMAPEKKAIVKDDYFHNRLRNDDELKKHENNIRHVLTYSNATPIDKMQDANYLCCYCDSQYLKPADLKTHTQETHNDETNPAVVFFNRKKRSNFSAKIDITGLKCKICATEIESLEKLMDHLHKDHDVKIYTDIKNHIIPFKFDNDYLTCCMCPNTFDKFQKLRQHMNIHYRNYICEKCDLGFVTMVSLKHHSEAHKVGTFNCTFCEKIFDTSRKKKSHEATAHIKGYFSSKCGYCNERFISNQRKDEHLAEVHGISHVFKCRACDRIFKSKKSLTTHTKRDHLLERRFKCTSCDMKFFNTSELKQHELKHSGVKDFKCDVCLKTYARRKTLIEHLKIHADIRRFKCDFCGCAFVQKCGWRGHMRSKHGENV